MNSKSKQLSDLMKIRYLIEINPIPDEDGGGYNASIPELGSSSYCGWGKSIEEALQSLNKVKRHLFKKQLDNRII